MNKEFIYENGIEAFSYLVIFCLTVALPMFISIIMDMPLMQLYTMFLNSLGLMREYLLLIKFKQTSTRFWVERLIGIVLSVSIGIYSVIAMAFSIYNIFTEILSILNIIFSSLIFFGCVISGIEGIIYIKNDFKNNVVNEHVTIARNTAIDV